MVIIITAARMKNSTRRDIIEKKFKSSTKDKAKQMANPHQNT